LKPLVAQYKKLNHFHSLVDNMSSDWTEQVFQHMRKSPCTVMDLSVIGAVVRRPAGCAKNSKLVDWIERDSRFKVQRSGQNKLVVNVGLVDSEKQAVVPKILAAAPAPIASIADAANQFTVLLEGLTEEKLRLCQKHAYLKAKYDGWKAAHGSPYSWKALKTELIRRGRFIFLSDNKFEQAVPNQPIKLASRATHGEQKITSGKAWVTVGEFCFDKNVDGSQRTLAKGQQVTAVGDLKCAAGGGGSAGVFLTKIKAVRNQHEFKFSLIDDAHPNATATLVLPLPLSPRERVRVAVHFTAQQSCAVVNTELLFFFLNNGVAFVIKRPIKIHIGDAAAATLLAPIAPYHRPQQRAPRPRNEKTEMVIVDGVRPAGAEKADTFYVGPGMFPVPLPWRLKCRVGLAAALLTQQRQSLSASNIKELFHRLVWTEELQMDIDIKSYSIDNKALTARGEFLCLDVPGLAEKRPSVLKGDSVIVHRPDQASATVIKYRGYVHATERDMVCLKFDAAFHQSYTAHTTVNVEFTFTRMPLRICHQGIDALTPALIAHLLTSPASPSSAAASTAACITDSAPLPPISLQPIDGRLNAQQLLAVERIVQHSNRSHNCPYILYGPPGTGRE
jgi:hypothetical protein